eukprot:gene16133-biopygen10990
MCHSLHKRGEVARAMEEGGDHTDMEEEGEPAGSAVLPSDIHATSDREAGRENTGGTAEGAHRAECHPAGISARMP